MASTQTPGSFTLPTQASTGFTNASKYDAHRATYPASAMSAFLHRLEVLPLPAGSGARIIEIGAGTGKFTERLVEFGGSGDEGGREGGRGYEIIAVEPHEQMRSTLKEKRLGGVKVMAGDAAHLPVEDGWGDACVAAQAFHWFATEETLREIYRVLRPGAVLGMIWNIEEYNYPASIPATTTWQQTLKTIFTRLDDGHPRFRHMKWKSVFEAQISQNPLQTIRDTFSSDHPLPEFSLPLGEDSVEWDVWLTEQGIWDRYSTLTQIANLEEGEKEKIREEVFEAFKGEDVVRDGEGRVQVKGMTYFAWTSRV